MLLFSSIDDRLQIFIAVQINLPFPFKSHIMPTVILKESLFINVYAITISCSFIVYQLMAVQWRYFLLI